MNQDPTITASVSGTSTPPAVDTTVSIESVTVDVSPPAAEIVIEATTPVAVTTPVVTAPVAAEPAVTVVIKPPTVDDTSLSVTTGTITTDTNAAVGTGSEDGTVAASLAAKLSQAELVNLGIANFSEDGQQLIQDILQTGSDLAKGTITDLLQYAIEMGPTSRVTPLTGSPKQVALYRTLMNGINNGSSDFPLMFATILRIVYELKTDGAFQEKLIYRYFPSMALNKPDRDAFAGLIHTLISLAATSGRGTAMKQIDFNKLTTFGYTQAGRQRLLSFFNM